MKRMTYAQLTESKVNAVIEDGRMMRRDKKKESDVLDTCRHFMEELDLNFLPSERVLRRLERYDLIVAIRRYGGYKKVREQLQSSNINSRQAHIAGKIGEPLNTYFKREYTENKKTTKEIGEVLGVSASTICNWMDDFGIERRKTNGLPDGISKPTKNQLKQWYCEDRKSIEDISDDLNVSGTTVSGWLDEYGISKRTMSESRLPKGVSKPSKKQLTRLYLEERRSNVYI